MTNLEVAEEACPWYGHRGRIEFLFRDAKQFTGLEDCQARSEAKLDFHFNMSLAAVNLARLEMSRQGISFNSYARLAYNRFLIARLYEAHLPLRRRARHRQEADRCAHPYPPSPADAHLSMMTRDLLEMAHWLTEHQGTHVAMEATGACWRPVFNVLEGFDVELFLVNPHDFKAVPGRKTNVQDAQWLADLLRHGLLRPSFVPDRAQRELRELVRYRRKLIEERTRAYNRLEKVLEAVHAARSAQSYRRA